MSTFVNLAEVIYPVGSVYESTSSASPATLFGGTWSSISGRMLIGANSTYAAKATGGEATHKLTVKEMPSHNHTTSQSAIVYHSLTKDKGGEMKWEAQGKTSTQDWFNTTPVNNGGGQHTTTSHPTTEHICGRGLLNQQISSAYSKEGGIKCQRLLTFLKSVTPLGQSTSHLLQRLLQRLSEERGLSSKTDSRSLAAQPTLMEQQVERRFTSSLSQKCRSTSTDLSLGGEIITERGTHFMQRQEAVAAGVVRTRSIMMNLKSSVQMGMSQLQAFNLTAICRHTLRNICGSVQRSQRDFKSAQHKFVLGGAC